MDDFDWEDEPLAPMCTSELNASLRTEPQVSESLVADDDEEMDERGRRESESAQSGRRASAYRAQNRGG